MEILFTQQSWTDNLNMEIEEIAFFSSILILFVYIKHWHRQQWVIARLDSWENTGCCQTRKTIRNWIDVDAEKIVKKSLEYTVSGEIQQLIPATEIYKTKLRLFIHSFIHSITSPRHAVRFRTKKIHREHPIVFLQLFQVFIWKIFLQDVSSERRWQPAAVNLRELFKSILSKFIDSANVYIITLFIA